jgi:hypothetical protein
MQPEKLAKKLQGFAKTHVKAGKLDDFRRGDNPGSERASVFETAEIALSATFFA